MHTCSVYIQTVLVFNTIQLGYRPGQPNADSTKNVLLLKDPQFLPNHNETLPKQRSHEYPILSKFRYDWVKIVDFLIKAYFSLSLSQPNSQCNPYLFLNSLDLDHYPYYSESPKFSDNLKSYLICNKNYSIATLSTTILISKIITSRNLLLRILYQKVLYNTKLNFFRFKQKKKSIFIIPEPITTYLCATLAPRMLVQITVQSD